MEEYLWAYEIDYIDRLKPKASCNQLASLLGQDHVEANFQIVGLIIEAADKGRQSQFPQCSSLTCFACSKPACFQDSPLWLTVCPGDEFITLDAPVVLSMNPSDDGVFIKQGAQNPAGVKVAYVLQYHLGETQGMLFKKGGLVFLQHMGTGRHCAQLCARAAVMEKQMAHFGSQVACRQANKMHSTGSTGP